MMREVCKTDLVGFRTPTNREREKMSQYILRDQKRSRCIRKIWGVIAAVFFLSCLIGVSLANSETPAGERIVGSVIAIVSGFALILMWKYDRKSRKLIHKIKNGQFEILECRVSEAEAAVDAINTANVKIYTPDGQYCTDHFLVDHESIKIWESKKDKTFYLLRCQSEQTEEDPFFELFSDEKMDRGK